MILFLWKKQDAHNKRKKKRNLSTKWHLQNDKNADTTLLHSRDELCCSHTEKLFSSKDSVVVDDLPQTHDRENEHIWKLKRTALWEDLDILSSVFSGKKQRESQRPMWLSHPSPRQSQIFPGIDSREILQALVATLASVTRFWPEIMVLNLVNHMVQKHYT